MDTLFLIQIPASVARERGLPRYFTGKPCKRGHIAERNSNSACIECERERCREYNKTHKDVRARYLAENMDAQKEWRAQWSRDNAKKIAAQKRVTYAANPEKHRARRREYYDKNNEKSAVSYQRWKDANAGHLKAYYEANKHRFTHRTAIRRAQKLRATPKWLTPADLERISRLYKVSRRISELTGIPHEVDHIVALNAKEACGLHVPWNLRVITEEENLWKNNRLIGDRV